MKIRELDIKHAVSYRTYILYFKKGDIHPISKYHMESVAVKIIAPDDEAAKITVRHRFGNSFHYLERKKGICQKDVYETLIWKKP